MLHKFAPTPTGQQDVRRVNTFCFIMTKIIINKLVIRQDQVDYIYNILVAGTKLHALVCACGCRAVCVRVLSV